MQSEDGIGVRWSPGYGADWCRCAADPHRIHDRGIGVGHNAVGLTEEEPGELIGGIRESVGY